jgi:hypothetical protein
MQQRTENVFDLFEHIIGSALNEAEATLIAKYIPNLIHKHSARGLHARRQNDFRWPRGDITRNGANDRALIIIVEIPIR